MHVVVFPKYLLTEMANMWNLYDTTNTHISLLDGSNVLLVLDSGMWNSLCLMFHSFLEIYEMLSFFGTGRHICLED